MGAHPFPAQDETTALEGLMERARTVAEKRRPLLSLSQGFGKSRLMLAVAGNHDNSSFNHVSLFSHVIMREIAHATHSLQCLNNTANKAGVRFARMLDAIDSEFLGPRDIIHFNCHALSPTDAQLCKLGIWAKDHAKSLARKRRFRADVVSPRKFLERWMTDVAVKATEWSFAKGRTGKTQTPAELAEGERFIIQMAMAFGSQGKLAEIVRVASNESILHLLDACHRDFRTTTSSIALEAARSREIVPTRSVTPRSARPTTRNLCVIRRRPTVDRALRRARMSAAPLAAPAPHAAARASEIRSTSALRGSPRRRLRSPGGAMARAVTAA